LSANENAVDMSYDLHLHFDPAVDGKDFLAFFSQRKRYVPTGTTLVYENTDTGVSFTVKYKAKKSMFATPRVVDAHIEISYCRPSFFGLEAEIEVSAIAAKFTPKIDDPQIRGMGTGPYSTEGFICGWNYGNSFALRTLFANNPTQKMPTMAGERLRAAWAWNYGRDELTEKVNEKQFVPAIKLLLIRGVPSSAVVWGLGMPILLPTVDYVLVGREVNGAKECGLSPWSEVIKVARSAGIDVQRDPIEIKYAVTPHSIAEWVAEIPAFDLTTLTPLALHQVIDTEIAAS
jgi:hypothetical protein